MLPSVYESSSCFIYLAGTLISKLAEGKKLSQVFYDLQSSSHSPTPVMVIISKN